MQNDPAARPFITLRDVAIRMGDRVLFEHTHWALRSDEHWAVLGPNGSGKSVLMRALCGQVPIVGGEIVYHFAMPGAPPWPSIALVAFGTQRSIVAEQDPFHQARWHSDRSHEGQTLGGFLALNSTVASGAAHGALLQMLRLDRLLARSMVQLSNGERRKAFLARALLRAPSGGLRLLILDNPFTGLDSAARAGLRDAVGQLMLAGDVRVIVVGAGDECLPECLPSGITHVLRVAGGRVASQGPVARDQRRAPAVTTRLRFGPAVQSGAELVRMSGVRVAYNGTTVLDGVDWSVREGEHWALVGPNGAGKTTLLSLLLGDHPQAYANTVELFGRQRGSGETIWEIKQQVGWVAPELHLYYPPESTCLDVVCSGFHDSVGLFHPCTQAQREGARAALARLGTGAHADALAPVPFARLSEGEQRMVLVARALVKHPRLLVLDEPCQGLDAANQTRVLEAVDALGRSGAGAPAVIYVTHDGVFPSIITHILQLDAGKVVRRAGVVSDARPVA